MRTGPVNAPANGATTEAGRGRQHVRWRDLGHFLPERHPRVHRCIRCNAHFPGSHPAAGPGDRRPRSADPRDHRLGRASFEGRRTPIHDHVSATTFLRYGLAPRAHDPPVPVRERRCRSQITAATSPMNPALRRTGSAVGVRGTVQMLHVEWSGSRIQDARYQGREYKMTSP